MKKRSLIFLCCALSFGAAHGANIAGFLGGSPPAAGGGLAAFSDDFNRANSDSLGANWTEIDTDVDIASNKAAVPGQFDNSKNFAVYSGTACTTASQYVRSTLTYASTSRPSLIVRYTDASSAFYELEFDVANNLLTWYHWTALGGTRTQLAQKALTLVSGTIVGVTITGTGTSTYIRIWNGCTGLPSAADTWNGDNTPDQFFDDNPSSAADSGGYVGIGCGASGAGDVTHDDFAGGDIP